MSSEYWKIIWRDRRTGEIVFTGLTEYATWLDADNALSINWNMARNYTATIERYNREAA